MSTSQDNHASATRFRWQASHTGLASAAATAALLVAAGPTSTDARVVAALALAVGMLCGFSHSYRLKALLTGLLLGLLIGAISSFDLLAHDVVGRFDAVAATVTVFLLLGLVFGGFAEIVRLFHRLTHGRKPGAE